MVARDKLDALLIDRDTQLRNYRSRQKKNTLSRYDSAECKIFLKSIATSVAAYKEIQRFRKS